MKFLLIFCLSATLALAQNPPECSSVKEGPETTAAPVNLPQLLQAIAEVKDNQNRLLVGSPIAADLKQQITALFDRAPASISKMEQFFGLLYTLARYRQIKDRHLVFSQAVAQKLLLVSQVFSDPQIPSQVKEVQFEWDPNFEKAQYRIEFIKPTVEIALNHGKGFGVFREGLCQLAKSLFIYGWFTFDVKLNDAKHLEVSPFENIDLYGNFGSRSMVNVDIHYVSIRSVEFLSGSPMGVVRAKISKREFVESDHTWLLEWVSKFVTDKSVQPIDW